MSETGDFVAFGPDHITVLLGLAAAVVWLLLCAKQLRSADDRWVRRSLALFLIGQEIVSWVVGLTQGFVLLPLQLCDIALWLTVWALLSLRPGVGELAYFWGLAGSLQAIITPDLREAFPGFWWWSFFLGHCGVVFSVVYLAATDRIRPTHSSLWRVWLVTNAYAAVVGLGNWAWGTNYGYLAHKPAHPSILDWLGPWPYYILSMEAIAFLSFYLYYFPFVLARRWRG